MEKLRGPPHACIIDNIVTTWLNFVYSTWGEQITFCTQSHSSITFFFYRRVISFLVLQHLASKLKLEEQLPKCEASCQPARKKIQLLTLELLMPEMWFVDRTVLIHLNLILYTWYNNLHRTVIMHDMHCGKQKIIGHVQNFHPVMFVLN